MYVGLTLTDASIFQMLRGSIIVFTAVLSVIFLKARYGLHKWIGIALVIVGTLTVGLASFACKKDGDSGADDGNNKAMLGNALIIIAQVCLALILSTIDFSFTYSLFFIPGDWRCTNGR